MSYENTRLHLLDELERIEALLETYTATTEGMSSKIDSAAGTEVEETHDPTTLTPRLPDDTAQHIADRAAQIDQRCRDTPADVSLRLQVLADRFDLSRAHLDVFLLALAPEIDANYQDVFGKLYGDAITHPTVGMIGDLFSRSDDQQLAATALVGPGSPLRQHDLVTLSDPVGSSRSHQHRLVTVDQRLVSYLEGHVDLDPALEHVATLPTPDRTLEDLQLEPALRDRLERVDADSSGRYYFHGPDDDEREAAIGALADDRLLRASLPAVLEADALERLHREALLQDCPVHLTDADVLRERGSDRTLEEVFDRFADLQCELFVTGTEAWRPTGTTVGIDAIIEFPRPSVETRQAFWEARADALPADLEPAVLAGTFELTRGQLEAALSTARSLAGGDDLTAEDIYEAVAPSRPTASVISPSGSNPQATGTTSSSARRPTANSD